MMNETNTNFCECGTFMKGLDGMDEEEREIYSEQLEEIPEEEYSSIRYCPSCGEFYSSNGSFTVEVASKEEEKGSGGKVVDDETADMLGFS